jgi:hypothetical protein
MLDSNQSHESCQYRYVQISPRFLCRNASRFQQISEVKGFRCKCRDPRCSIQCHANAAQKDAAIVARHLHDLPAEYTAYRGNLTLDPGATPADHRRVKKAFLRSLNRWKTRKSYTVEIMARTHATDSTNAHYDILAFTDAPHKPFHSSMLDLWERAGGKQRNDTVRGATLVRLKDHEKDASAKYQQKAIDGLAPIVKEDFRATTPPPKLLNSRKISGLDLTWRTDGFWRGTTPDAIWTMLIAEWHAPAISDDEVAEWNLQRAIDGKPPLAIPEPMPEPLPPAYIPGIDLRRDAWVFREHMPTTPQSAVGANDLAERWGVDGDWMLRCFKTMPNAVRLDGEIVGGSIISNAWYIDKIGNSPINMN